MAEAKSFNEILKKFFIICNVEIFDIHLPTLSVLPHE